MYRYYSFLNLENVYIHFFAHFLNTFEEKVYKFERGYSTITDVRLFPRAWLASEREGGAWLVRVLLLCPCCPSSTAYDAAFSLS